MPPLPPKGPANRRAPLRPVDHSSDSLKSKSSPRSSTSSNVSTTPTKKPTAPKKETSQRHGLKPNAILHREVPRKAATTLPSPLLVAHTGIYQHLSRQAFPNGMDVTSAMPTLQGTDPLVEEIFQTISRERVIIPRPPTGYQKEQASEQSLPATPFVSMDLLAVAREGNDSTRDPDGIVVKDGELVRHSPACIHMQRLLRGIEGYDVVLSLVMKLCRDYTVNWAEISLKKFEKLLHRPLLYPVTKSDLISILANKSDVERIIHLPGQRYKSMDRKDAAAITIQRNLRMYLCKSSYVLLLAQRIACRSLLKHWESHLTRRRTYNLVMERRERHQKVSVELYLKFRDNWAENKNKARLLVHIPSLSCPPGRRDKYGAIDSWYWQQISKLTELLTDPHLQILYVVPPGQLHKDPVKALMDSLGSPVPSGLQSKFNRIRVLQPENGHLLPEGSCLASMLMISPWALQEIRAMAWTVGNAFIVPGICGSSYVKGSVTEEEVLSSVLGVPLYSHPSFHHLMTGEESAQSQALSLCDFPIKQVREGTNCVNSHYVISPEGNITLVGTTETLHMPNNSVLGYRIPQSLAEDIQIVVAGERLAKQYYTSTRYCGDFAVEFLIVGEFISVSRVFCHQTPSLQALVRFVLCTESLVDQVTGVPFFDRNQARAPELEYLSKSPYINMESVVAAAGMTSETGRDDEQRCGLVIEGALHPNLYVMSRIALKTITGESGIAFDSIWRVGSLFVDCKVAPRNNLQIICSASSHEFAATTAIQTLVMSSRSLQLPTLPPTSGNFREICDVLSSIAQSLPASLDPSSNLTLTELEVAMAGYLPPEMFAPRTVTISPEMKNKINEKYLESTVIKMAPAVVALLDAPIPSESLNRALFVVPPPIVYEYGTYRTEVGNGPEEYLKQLDASISAADGRLSAQQQEELNKKELERLERERVAEPEQTQLGKNWEEFLQKRMSGATSRAVSVVAPSRQGSVFEAPDRALSIGPPSISCQPSLLEPSSEGTPKEGGASKGKIKGLFVAQGLADMFKSSTSVNKK
ncbi:hypothetical protein SmJEL517_g02403 [Synchytrium microbalum]|uniref:Uncharacterized protein n=1 Tax=Synchytrium microbalum TaxID=1806994 RepID=A0A507CAL8_9FUNG|nr:uncharacterized protein SmJEL517_g02403 [Synchytrium microbalum]TPX35056.1 hypothetical protein SmJEL517_g02403 [Synchytrium microbalum]